MNKEIFDIIENALAKAGYKVLDGDAYTVIVRDCKTDKDYEIEVKEAVS